MSISGMWIPLCSGGEYPMNHLEAGVYPHQCAGDVENPYPLINITLQHSPLFHPYFKALNDRVYVGGTHIPQTSGNIISESHQVSEVEPPLYM